MAERLERSFSDHENLTTAICYRNKSRPIPACEYFAVEGNLDGRRGRGLERVGLL